LISRPLKIAFFGFAFLGTAVFGAFVYDRAFRPRPPRGLAGSVLHPAPPSAAAIPERRPDLSLKDLEGRPHSLAEWDGKALVINFWATWCAPCRHEIPLLNQIRRDNASKGFEVVGIAVDFADDVRTFLKDFPVGYPLLVGEEDGLAAARAFGVEAIALPFTVFTDRTGRIITLHLGELHAAQAEVILAAIARVDAGELTQDAARLRIEAGLKALGPTGIDAAQRPRN
jgi:thiol-disulfide isomerase/thioredoxin